MSLSRFKYMLHPSPRRQTARELVSHSYGKPRIISALRWRVTSSPTHLNSHTYPHTPSEEERQWVRE